VADTVLFAAGITPRSYMGMQADAEVRRGIIVDAEMKTSEPHIWACGDCAEFEGHTGGLWSAAMEQGKVAGTNAAGGSAVYAASPLQRHFRDVHVATQHAMVGTDVLETAGAVLLGESVSTARL
jgi:NAD(P)H-nitrite reductase large subunit